LFLKAQDQTIGIAQNGIEILQTGKIKIEIITKEIAPQTIIAERKAKAVLAKMDVLDHWKIVSTTAFLWRNWLHIQHVLEYVVKDVLSRPKICHFFVSTLPHFTSTLQWKTYDILDDEGRTNMLFKTICFMPSS